TDGTNYNAVSQPSGYIPMGDADEFGAQATEMLLDRGNTTDTVTYNYRLRMWVGSNYQVSGEEKHFTLKVNVYGNDGVSVEVNGVELDKSSATVKLTNSLQLNASTTPASPSDKTITWTSSNEKIATVTNTGLVETKGVGTTTITATASNGKSASANIKVEANNTNITGAYTYNETTCPTGREETCQPTTCVMSGTCPAGTAISYKVNDTTTQDFYVLKDNGSTLTLISKDSVVSSVWDSSGNTINGPRTATQALENATKEWTNLSMNTYNEKTGIARRARLITKQEAEFLGCRAYETSCPIWLADGGSYHWVSSAYVSSSELAWAITNSNLRYLDGYSVLNLYAVRAVIDIDK
ncbi:MAG: hypothetical protein HFJ38_02580, partial [Bacilli bacterium]|nr:hypothetical protein [Bacilli bacterium]